MTGKLVLAVNWEINQGWGPGALVLHRVSLSKACFCFHNMMAGFQEKASQDNLAEMNDIFCELAFKVISLLLKSHVKAVTKPLPILSASDIDSIPQLREKQNSRRAC